MSVRVPDVVTSASDRSPYHVVLGGLAAVVLALVLAVVPLPGAKPLLPLVQEKHASTMPAWKVRANWISYALAMPPRASAKVLGVWPQVAALGLAAVAAGVVSAARGRPVREGGRVMWAAALVVSASAGAWYIASAWDSWEALRPAASKVLAATALVLFTLGYTAANVGIGKATGISGTVVGIAGYGAGLLFFVAQYLLSPEPGDRARAFYEVPLVDDLLGLAITLPGGLWLVRRYRLGEVDLTGPLAACPTPAEVAVLPCVASTGVAGGIWASVLLSRKLLPGPLDLGWLVETGWPWVITRTTLAVLSVAGLAWLLARRERRDRQA